LILFSVPVATVDFEPGTVWKLSFVYAMCGICMGKLYFVFIIFFFKNNVHVWFNGYGKENKQTANFRYPRVAWKWIMM